MPIPKTIIFKKAAQLSMGNIKKIAEAFHVERKTVYNWLGRNNDFNDIINDERGRLFDMCLEHSRIIALGIPNIDENGKFTGWKVRPDSRMLIFLIDKLGKNEGFGQSVKINSKRKNNVQLIFQDARVLTKKEHKELLNLENKAQNDG